MRDDEKSTGEGKFDDVTYQKHEATPTLLVVRASYCTILSGISKYTAKLEL